MDIINYLLCKYRQWRLRSVISAAKSGIDVPVKPSLLLDMLNACDQNALKNYQVKQGFTIWVDTSYKNVMTLLNDLTIVYNALTKEDLTSIGRTLIKKSRKSTLLVDYLVDTNSSILPITTVEELIRNRVLQINAIIIAADEETKVYYLRKLTNILRETFVVTEALLKAADLTWHQISIRKLLRF